MRVALAPPFMTLRRLLVQLSGLMLLSGGRRGETQDGIAVSLAALGPELAAVQDRLRQADWRRFPQVAPVLAAAADVAAAMTKMEQALTSCGERRDQAEGALALLIRAQRRLMAVSDDRAGMAMVGFAHACCCGPAPRTVPLSCN